MELAFKILEVVALIALSFYMVLILIDLFKYLISNHPSDGKSELHSRDRYEVADKIKDDSDLGTFF